MSESIKINVIPGHFAQEYHLSQYDEGRELIFILGEGSAPYSIPQDAVITLEGTKPSTLGFVITCEYDSETATATAVTTLDMTDESGTVVAELVIRDGEDRIGSANIRFEIERSPHPDGTTDGRGEQIVPALTLILQQIEADMEKAEVLQESEAWAVGQRNGADVDEDDDTYHNNSKYYATQAALSEAAASESEENALEAKNQAAASASNAATALSSAEAAADAAEAAAEAAASVFAVVGNVTFTVLENGQVREIWTEEEE